MTKKDNKVTFGLENVHIAPITSVDTDGVITYGEVFRFPGAIELELNPKGESGSLKADNIDYYLINTNEGYEGKYKCAHIIQKFLTEILGEKLDEETGVMTEVADVQPKEFAMMFQFEGDVNKTRHVLYYCSASRPSNGSGTKDGSKVNERELDFKASPRPLDKVVKRSIPSDGDETIYKDWFKKPYEPARVGG